MAIKYVKKLVHDGGDDFVIWHPEASVYCPVLCDEDYPPDPMYLGLRLHDESVTDVASLKWELTGDAYDSVTGESV